MPALTATLEIPGTRNQGSTMTSISRKTSRTKYNSSTLPLHHYAYKNDTAAIQDLLSYSYIDTCARDVSGRTALFVAARFARVEIARMLLALGCDPNFADHDGNTPLHESTEKCCLPMVQLLLKSGKCKLDSQNKLGQTPLMKAAFFDYVDITKVLVQKGVDLDARDVGGKTALLYALAEGSEKTAEYLMKKKCDVNLTDNAGHTALYTAVHSHLFHSTTSLLLLEESDYDFTKDACWLDKEERSSKFYHYDDVYFRFLKSAGILKKTNASSALMLANTDTWSTQHTKALTTNRYIATPKPQADSQQHTHNSSPNIPLLTNR